MTDMAKKMLTCNRMVCEAQHGEKGKRVVATSSRAPHTHLIREHVEHHDEHEHKADQAPLERGEDGVADTGLHQILQPVW